MDLLTAIVVLPLAGFLVNGLFGARLGRGFVSAVGCGLPILAFAAAIRCFLSLTGGDGAPLVSSAYTWGTVGGQVFGIAFWFDRLSAVMTLIITGVGSLIHVYSAGYMQGRSGLRALLRVPEPVPVRMLMLVLGRTLLVCSSAGRAWASARTC